MEISAAAATSHVATTYANEVNNFSVSELNYISDTISRMNKFNQVEVLRLLSKHPNVTLNENKYGIHVNLSELSKDLLNELVLYIKYVTTQEGALQQFEKEKEICKNIYFIAKNIKDNIKR